MECMATAKLPDGRQWLWEIKLDGYRALAVKNASGITLFSRRKKSLNRKFPCIVEALADLPAGTVLDGELVGLDDTGRPDFNLLQNYRGGAARIYYYIFDLLCCKDRDLTRLPLVERRSLLKSLVTSRDKRIRVSDYIEAGANELLAAAREQHLEGIVGKRRDSIYEPGKRSGAWIKHRVNRGLFKFQDVRFGRAQVHLGDNFRARSPKRRNSGSDISPRRLRSSSGLSGLSSIKVGLPCWSWEEAGRQDSMACYREVFFFNLNIQRTWRIIAGSHRELKS
jgi:ATP-dependent DNA ligase